MAVRILVAQCDHVMACDLCDTVAEAGYEVEGPLSGISTTRAACEAHRPDLVILDVVLCDGTSYELAEQLLNDNVRVILHSDRDVLPEVAARSPRAITLLRPCPPTELLDTVQRVLMPV